MEKLRTVLKVVTVLTIIFVIVFGGAFLYMLGSFNVITNNTEMGRVASGTVTEFKNAAFYFGGDTFEIVADFTSEDGETHAAHLLTKTSGIKPGDSYEFYYNKEVPSIVGTYEMREILFGFYIITLIVLGALLAAVIIARIIIRIVKGPDPKKKEKAEPSEYEIERGARLLNEKRNFWMTYERSIQSRNQMRLADALSCKKQCVNMTKAHTDYACMAYHNLMVTQFFQCCDGEEAYKSGIKSLEAGCEKEFKELSEKLQAVLKFNAYDESLVYTAMLAKSREEAVLLLKKGAKRKNYPRMRALSKEMLEKLERFPSWLEFQKMEAGNYYSRVNADKDRGDYSPACAILGLILSREGEPGYDISEEDYVNLLDDYLMVSLRYFTLCADTLLKYNGNPENQLLFILKKPLETLIGFLPDCQEKRYRELFKSVLKEYEVYGPKFEKHLPQYNQARKALGM